MIKKILIANRGEIAVRIIRACREMGIETVAVYSEADRDALHTKLADEAVCIGPAASSESYLSMDRIISATIVTGADAIHPGFGFLSENSRFAELCEQCSITFIGPGSDVIARLGNKQEARNTMIDAGVPVIPGSTEPIYDAQAGAKAAEEIGYPVIVKAALGGGGKGMRVANTPEEFEQSFQTAQKETQMAFGDNMMYIEHFVQHPRHIEFQILADSYGNVIHLGERDCSIQRNHQNNQHRQIQFRQHAVQPVCNIGGVGRPTDDKIRKYKVKQPQRQNDSKRQCQRPFRNIWGHCAINQIRQRDDAHPFQC